MTPTVGCLLPDGPISRQGGIFGAVRLELVQMVVVGRASL
jgi:hypothetical protein